MKKLLFLLFIIPIAVAAQVNSTNNFPMKDGKVIYESVMDVPGVKMGTMYAASKKWLAETFVDSKSVIETEDKDLGQIIGKANASVSYPAKSLLLKGYAFTMYFNIQIDCKDEKYRIRFYNITTSNSSLAPRIPIETFTVPYNQNKFKGKQLEKAKASKEAIESKFTLLLDSFNSSVNKANADKF